MNQPDSIPGTMQSAASVADLPGRTEVSARLTSRSTAAKSEASTPRTATRLSGRWLWLARVAWLSVATVSITSFFPSLPLSFAELEQVCTGSACDLLSLRPEHLPVLAAWGLSPAAFAAYGTVLGSVQNLAWYAMGVLLFARQSADPRALFFSFCLMLYGGGPSYQTLAVAPPSWWLPVTAYLFLVTFCFTLFLVLFPTGQFVPRWTRWLALAWIVVQVPTSFFPDSPLSEATWPSAVQALVLLGFFGSFIVAQVHRYGWRSTPLERQQTKWVLLALGVLLLLIVARGPVGTLVLGGEAPPLWLVLVVGNAFALATILVPLSIAAAILRYRLWEIDRLLNRSLVYGALIASIVQRGINRLMYGERDDPSAVLARLGQRLEATLAPEAVLPTIVQTVRDALRLPYVAIVLSQGETFEVAVSTGKPVQDTLSLPLVYQGETVGQFLVGARTPGEAFSAADRHVLHTIAYQAGAAVHTVRLTTALQRSRQHLVTAREEERRRLRRDLHDGLGPALATLALQAEAAHDLLPAEPEQSAAYLADLITQAHSALADIRRLVYALRPPALDALGLVGALKEQATQYARQGLSILVDAPECLPPLPAAVEVAAYRILQEALTNVVRHAQACTCTVSLHVNDALDLVVTDDGRGFPTDCHAGVGLPSMRERAAELGGTCQITSTPGQGTCLRVCLPRQIG